MSVESDIELRISSLIMQADQRYGDFTSSHEALGVITEEYDELIDTIRANDLIGISREAEDLAAACIRLARAARSGTIAERSRK